MFIVEWSINLIAKCVDGRTLGLDLDDVWPKICELFEISECCLLGPVRTYLLVEVQGITVPVEFGRVPLSFQVCHVNFVAGRIHTLI